MLKISVFVYFLFLFHPHFIANMIENVYFHNINIEKLFPLLHSPFVILLSNFASSLIEFLSVNFELYLSKCFLSDENVLASPPLHSKAHQQRRKYPKFIHHQVDEMEHQNQSLTQKKEAMVKTKGEGDSEGDSKVAEGGEVVVVVEAEDTVDFSIDKREEKAKF